NSPNTTGAMVVDGPTTTLNVNFDFGVGNQGVGTLTVQNGAHVNHLAETLSTGGNGPGNGLPLGTGNITVTDPGSTITSGGAGFIANFHMGFNGTGTLNILNGGTVNVLSGYSYQAAAAGTVATINVSGAGSQWNIGAAAPGFTANDILGLKLGGTNPGV